MNDEIEIVNEEDTDKAENKLKKIKEELNVCRKEKEEYLTGWQRAKADFINYKKNEEKGMEEFAKFAAQNMILEMLRVMDSVEMALKHKESEGVKEIKSQFLEVLRKYGVEEIKADKGEKFHPAEHESIAEEGIDKEDLDGTIVEELQKGYKLFNRVLRPSKVKVGTYKIKDKK